MPVTEAAPFWAHWKWEKHTCQALSWSLPTTLQCVMHWWHLMWHLLPPPLFKWIGHLTTTPGSGAFGTFDPITFICLMLQWTWWQVIEKSLNSYAERKRELWIQTCIRQELAWRHLHPQSKIVGTFMLSAATAWLTLVYLQVSQIEQH